MIMIISYKGAEGGNLDGRIRYMQGVKNETGEWIGFIERFELNLQM